MVTRSSARLSRKKNESLSSSEPTTIDSLELTASSEIVSTDSTHSYGVSEYGTRKSARLQKHTSGKYLEELEVEIPKTVHKKKRIEKNSNEKKQHTKEPSVFSHDRSSSPLRPDKTVELRLFGNNV